MRIAGITDIHGSKSSLAKFIKAVGKIDLLLVAGGWTTFGSAADLEQLLEIVADIPMLTAVAGNCDPEPVQQLLISKGLSCSGKVLDAGDVLIAGSGGSLACPGNTPYELTDIETEAILNNCSKEIEAAEAKPLIFISHQPPYEVLDIVGDNLHVGSKPTREFIENHNIQLCLTGHIHECKGSDKIDDTIVINPGPLTQGSYLEINTDGTDITWKIREF